MSVVSELPADWSRRFDDLAGVWSQVLEAPLPRSWESAFEAAAAARDELEAAGAWISGPASLMGVLRIRWLEVPHSRILGWLLDPTGHHGLGTGLLECFLARAFGKVPGRLTPSSVTLEAPCPDALDGTTRAVDVVVTGPDWTLVVENKIYSGQHGRQLDVYYDTFASDQTGFVYLTPAGRPAWSERSEVAKAWRPMSWRAHVIPALRDLVSVGSSAPIPPRGLAAITDYLVGLEEELR